MEKISSTALWEGGSNETFRSGFVAIVGAPNVGKSTLLNRIMEGHYAIVTEKPQTTRTVIRAIKNLEHAQLIFIDTPGIHASQKAFNKLLVQTAKNASKEADVILALISAEENKKEENAFLLSTIREITDVPKVLAINKIDKIDPQTPVEKMLKDVGLNTLDGAGNVFPISALHGTGVEVLVNALAGMLPESPPLFPQDMETDMTERFFASEIIREKIFLLAQEEIPYEIAVEIERFKEDEEKNMLIISAVIHVNRMSQKRIIVGKNGRLIKQIGVEARKDLEAFFQIHVYLDLWVKVTKNWMKNPRMLKELGIMTR